MAYAALVSLSHTIDKLLSHDHQYPISLHQKQQIISIHEYVIFLQVFLEDVPHKVDNALGGRIRDAANQAEDVIEYFTWRQMQSRYPLIKSKITKPNEVRFQDDHPNRNLYYDYSELDEVAEQVDSIAVEVMSIMSQSRFKETKVGDSGVVASSSSSSSSRIAPSHKKDAMVGFDDDLLAIKEQLRGKSSKLQVIPIAGMGGIGKTTLARSAYDDPLTMQYFDIRAWVTVSQDYSARKSVPNIKG